MRQDEVDLCSSENLLAPLNSWPRSNILVVKYDHDQCFWPQEIG